jgi:hypothetical protein
MSMNRREFVKYLALTAGAAALPPQIAALEQYYEINTPITPGPYLAMDEVYIGGIANIGSTPLKIGFYQNGLVILNCSLNAFGGCYFWRGALDHKIIANPANELTWKISYFDNGTLTDQKVREIIDGTASFVTSDGKRQRVAIDKATGVVGV